MKNQKTVVLIPCFNESKTIRKVVSDMKNALPEADIYVYDNNSTDGTAEIAADAGAIVKREYRQGKGNVIRSMFRGIDADCYIMIDGDDTYPAENAQEMEALVLSGKADMVIGDRLSSTYFIKNRRPFHNTGNRLVRFLINFIFHCKVNDIMTGYRAFSRTFVQSFPVLSRGFEIETEMVFCQLGVRGEERNRPTGLYRTCESLFHAHEWPLVVGVAYSMTLRGGFDSLETGLCHRGLRSLIVSRVERFTLNPVAGSEIHTKKIGNGSRHLLCVERTVLGSLSQSGNSSA